MVTSGNGLRTAPLDSTICCSRPGCGKIARSGGLPLDTRTPIWASNSLVPSYVTVGPGAFVERLERRLVQLVLRRRRWSCRRSRCCPSGRPASSALIVRTSRLMRASPGAAAAAAGPLDAAALLAALDAADGGTATAGTELLLHADSTSASALMPAMVAVNFSCRSVGHSADLRFSGVGCV